MKVVISINTAWNLVNFRGGLIRALIADGHEVIAFAPKDAFVPRLEAMGCRFIALPMDNGGTRPAHDLLLWLRYLKLFYQVRPDVYLGYTVKPNVYGSLAANFFGIPVVNNVAGLGAVFIRDSWLTRLVRMLYKAAFRRSHHVFFQNNEDMALFLDQGLISHGSVSRVPGSGIDLHAFRFEPAPAKEGQSLRFLLVARLLWDKGVAEYVEAARIVRQNYPEVRFQLLGFLDVENPTAVTRENVNGWVTEGVIEYLGVTDDVKPFMVAADCVVLPSYREGVPRSLLEAAAIGRPIVTTDAVGCRDVVDDGVNGYLCQIKNALDLSEKLFRMIKLSADERSRMGAAGREKMQKEFDEKIVIDRYLSILKKLDQN